MARAQRNSKDYSSIDDLSLPRGASVVRYMEEHGPIQERSNSDSNLNLLSPQSWSSLSVDKTVFWLRDIGKTPDSKVRVEWDIKEDVGAQDWIGLFYSGEEDATKFLDCKIRGSSGGSTGAIIWDLEVVEHLFSEAKNLVCFKYISGNTCQVLATSNPVTVFIVKNDLKAPSQVSSSDGSAIDNALYCLTIQDLYSSNLKKGMIFNSDPYVKFQVLPHSQRDHTQKHHYREHRSSVAFNTANPSWPTEKFKLEVLVTDLLDIEVKHKFSKSKPMMSRFLGHATIPVQNIVDCISTAQQKPVDFRLELMRKGPSDNVSGEVGFKANIYLLLQPLSNNASTSKVNGGLQRQASLPSALTWVEDGTPRASNIRHRHTDPGLAVAEALNLLSPRGVISEEQEDGELGSPAESVVKTKKKKTAANNKQTSGSGTVVEVFREADSSSLNSDVHFTSNPETPLDSSDSGTSVSVTSSCENSGGSIPSGIVVQSVYKPLHIEATEASQSLNQTVQPSSVQHDCDKTDIIVPAIANGQIASGDTLSGHSHLSDLDMSVQSAGLEYSLPGLRIDAPTLPPRTYKAAAPPVPPRIIKASAPPIPPRQAIDKPKHKGTEHARSALEPPPPLPPRTYSPVEFRDTGVEVADGAGMAGSQASSDICPSREQELFPWGPPACPASSNISGVDGSEVPNKRPVKYHRVDDRDDALPSGWEARVDSHGRIFYIDHVNRTTTWQRPQIGLPAVQRRTLSSEQRQQLDRRYQSIRRTMSQSQQQAEADSAPPGEARDITGASNQPDQSPSAASPPERVSERSERSVYKLPAVKFLTRPDFFPMLQANESAMVDYNRNSKLKHMITKIRRDPKTFERYQHNRDLVSFVNLFCDTSKELPRRWEMKYDRAGKAFFIDHVLRTTTFMDPRLPTDVPLINPDFLQNPPPRTRTVRTEVDAPPPPPRPSANDNTAAIPTAYNEKVVLFLRQPNVDELLRDRCPQYASSSSLRDKIAKISARGVEMLERYSNDIDLTLLLSLFENEIMSYVPPTVCARNNQIIETTSQGSPQGSPVQRIPGPGRVPAPYKRDFQAKLRNFYKKLESKGYGQGPGKLKLTVRRDHVLEDAFNKIMSTPKKELQKNKLYITFAGEEGLDYGGPSREFFFLLSRELFNPYYGLFEYSANDTYTVQVSPLSTIVENAHEWFRFSGRVLGLALVHQYLLDAFFTRPFYKALLRVPLSLEDVESLDMEFHQSLLWIKDNDISELDLDLTFSVSEEVFGQVTERELKPNGKNISVTERNKKEYIEKMVKWRLERGVTEQTESLIRGFHEVLDGRLVSTFDARELELVIAGTVEIDITDWRRNTDYRSGYHDQHPVIQWFWEAIEKFDNERQLRLLQFVTGSSSIPYEGFSALRGSNGPRKFCIEKWGKTTSLPRAHTCFNRLDLPPYTSCEMLFEKLAMAVEETSTFGID
ncbi:hypothetical protein BsWGS_04881 [Bradybaena similaris]